MVPATQIVRTSRLAFAITIAGAWLGGTVLFTIAMWDEVRFSDALSSAGAASLALIPIAAVGAVLGGLIALWCGLPLSRQYCWLFSVVAGLLAWPVGGYYLVRAVIAFPQVSRSMAGGGMIVFQLPPLIGGLTGGIVVAVLLTRSRTQLGKRSRRAATITLIVALATCAVAEVIFDIVERGNGNTIFSLGMGWQIMLIMIGFCVVGASAVAAACCADDPDELRYEVLPLNPINPQTTTTADPASPVVR